MIVMLPVVTIELKESNGWSDWKGFGSGNVRLGYSEEAMEHCSLGKISVLIFLVPSPLLQSYNILLKFDGVVQVCAIVLGLYMR